MLTESPLTGHIWPLPLSRLVSAFESRLPLDIFYLVRDHLKRENMMGTAARLSPVSRTFYRIYGPIINYSRLSLRRENAHRVLEGVPRGGSPVVDCINRRCSMPNKVSRLNTCTHLEIFDLPALRILMSHQQIMDIASPLFPSVTHLSLGPHLVQHLGLSNDQHLNHLVRRFEQVFSPTCLCVTYPSYDCSIEFLRRRYEESPNDDDAELVAEWEEARDSLWQYHFYNGISHQVSNFANYWRPRTLILHDLGAQILPEAPCAEVRVLYACKEDMRVANGISRGVGNFRKLQESRLRDMADTVTMMGLRGGTTYEFVDSGLAPSDEQYEGEFGQRGTAVASVARAENNVEMILVDSEQGVRELFWKQFPEKEVREIMESQIRFVARTEANPCECCGGR